MTNYSHREMMKILEREVAEAKREQLKDIVAWADTVIADARADGLEDHATGAMNLVDGIKAGEHVGKGQAIRRPRDRGLRSHPEARLMLKLRDATAEQRIALEKILSTLQNEFTTSLETDSTKDQVQTLFRQAIYGLVSTRVLPEDHGLELEVQMPDRGEFSERPLDWNNPEDRDAMRRGATSAEVCIREPDRMKLILTSADERR